MDREEISTLAYEICREPESALKRIAELRSFAKPEDVDQVSMLVMCKLVDPDL